MRSGLAHSAEAEAGLGAAYGLELGRAADRGGLDYHEGRLAQGATAERVRSEIAHSAPPCPAGLRTRKAAGTASPMLLGSAGAVAPLLDRGRHGENCSTRPMPSPGRRPSERDVRVRRPRAARDGFALNGDEVLSRLERPDGHRETRAAMEAVGQIDVASSLAGYLGAAIVILGHFLNQRGRLRSEDWRFPAMNLLGSAFVMVSLVYHPNLPSVVIEIFWSSISIYGVRKNLRARREAPSQQRSA